MRIARGGVAIPTVFFFAMLVLFLATVLLTSTTQSLRATRWQADRTRARYVAMAAVNEALIRLRTDPGFENRTEKDPFVARYGLFEAHSWVTKDEEHPDVIFVHGRAWPVSNPASHQEFTRTVLRNSSNQGLVYSRVYPWAEQTLGLEPFDNHNLVANIFVGSTTDTSWRRLPPCPRRFYSRDGSLVERPGLFAISLYGCAADDQGKLYCCFDAWRDEGAPAYQQSYRFELATRDYGEYGPAEVPELMGRSFLAPEPIFTDEDIKPGKPLEPTNLVRFDPLENSWELMPRPPDVFYDGAGRKVEGDPRGVYDTMTSDGNDLFFVCNRFGLDFPLRFDTRQQTWSTLPPGKNLTYGPEGQVVDRGGLANRMFFAAAGRDGSLYANFGSSQTEQVLGRYDSQAEAWTTLPCPPHQAYDTRGQLARVDKLRFGRMAVDLSGDLHVIVRASAEGENLLDTVWTYSGGEWKATPPFPEQQEGVGGALVSTGKLTRRIDNLTVDVEGNLLVKTVHDDWVQETTFKVDRKGEATPLPLLTDHSVVDETGKQHPYPALPWKPRPFQHDLCGSGSAGPSGDTRFVPVASF